jgi:Gpi18-like mannosyltransferase
LIATYLALRPAPRPVLAGLVIGLASIVKPNGIMLNIILIYEFLKKRDWTISNIVRIGLSLFMSGLGLLVFMLYLQSISGSYSTVAETNVDGWMKTWKVPIVPIIEAVLFVFDPSAYPDWFSYVTNIVDLVFSLVAVGLTGVAVYLSLKRKFDWTMTIYMIATLTFLLSYRGSWVPLHGMARWVLLLFPMYQVLALLTEGRRRIHWLILSASASILLVFNAWWATGRWVG